MDIKANSDKQKFFSGPMVGFMIAVVIAVIGSISTIRYIYVMQQDLRTWYEKDLVGQNSVQIARVNLLNLDRDLKVLLLAGGSGKMESTMSNIRRHRDNFITQIATARPLFTSKRDSRYIESVFRLSKEYLDKLNAIMVSSDAARLQEISRNYADMSAKFDEIDRVLDKLDDIKQEKDLQVFRTIISQNEITMGITMVILVITIIVRAIHLSVVKKRRSTSSS
jgi:hypothetical protein